ncbi:MAG TPA: class II fructose-bisphosphate aldolase [Candidatus Polarisedimenticolia bacterium]|nr:class II fructose-bisphosphate aldolase [Candidatus Polarisedimenticolia bacterium]
MSDRTLSQCLNEWRGVIEVGPAGEVAVRDPARLRAEAIDELARQAVFADSPQDKERARTLIWEAARQTGVRPASIQPLYEAMGRGEVSGFTTPAINVRGMAYDTARAVVQAVRAGGVGAFIFELARSEMGYTFQRPGEYVSVVLAAAVREGFEGPVFIQGDHYQVNPGKFAAGGETRATEIQAIKDLIAEAIAAGYGNIDIDASTVVDLSKPTVREQQRDNFTTSAELAAHTRSVEPAGATVSIGGEIGEVGKQNSTPEELRAYMDGFLEELVRRTPAGKGWKGPSKISIQTGTTHGGVPLPDGTVAQVKIDFGVLREISDIARSEYGMAGAVQHGASTLPPDAFDHFPRSGAAEVHLATDFQNIVLDHPVFPKDLRAEMYAWLDRECASERKPGMTPEQYYYKTRKKAWGPFKKEVWGLPEPTRAALREALRSKFEFLFGKLGAVDTVPAVRRHVQPQDVKRTLPGA